LALALTACATAAAPPDTPADRWGRDLEAYADQLERFTAQVRQLGEDFRALRANPSFAAVEEKMKTLAGRTGSLDKAAARDELFASLKSMGLGEVLAFSRFLALSTQWVTLEAARSELESLRLDLWARRIEMARRVPGGSSLVRLLGQARDPSLVERPVPASLDCPTYLVGNLTFASCDY